MKKYYFYITIFNTLLLMSCINKKNADIGFKIQPPKHFELYNHYLSDSLHSSITLDTVKPIKLYVVINVSCATCLQKFQKWDRFYSELGELNNNVAIIPVCYSEDNFESLKFLFESKKLPPIKLPLVLDFDETFIKQNLPFWKKHGDFTVLTDSKNNVLLVGDPMEIDKDKKDFVEAIRNKTL